MAAGVVLAMHGVPAAAQTSFPSRPNCQLSTPPKNAVVVPTHGVDLLYYPPRAAIAPNYTGCQSAWFGDSRYRSDAQLLYRAHYEHGELQSVWVLDPEKPALHCQYSGGVVVKPSPPPAACPSASELPFNLQKVHK